MLGRLWKSQNEGKDKTVTVKRAAMNNGLLVELMRSFPIGGKIRYFPHNQKEMALESIVIAYGMNEHLVYTQNDIRSQTDGDDTFFVLDDDWTDEVVRKVDSFCLLIPYIVGNDGSLDYASKAAVHDWNPFQRGEPLGLMSLVTDQGVPHVDSVVRKRMTLRDGYYANHTVVVLEVDPATLQLIDQRQHRRLRTMLPIEMTGKENGEACDAVLVDYSEYHAKIEFDMTSSLAGLVETAKHLYITIPANKHGRSFQLKGKVFRRGDGYVVLEFIGMLKGRQFMALEVLDVLELKANILQHPATQ